MSWRRSRSYCWSRRALPLGTEQVSRLADEQFLRIESPAASKIAIRKHHGVDGTDLNAMIINDF